MARIKASWKYHHTRIMSARKMKPAQLQRVAMAVMPKETQPMTTSVRFTFPLRRKLTRSCHSTMTSSSGGKKKFRKALGTNSIRQVITNRAVKTVGR